MNKFNIILINIYVFLMKLNYKSKIFKRNMNLIEPKKANYK